MQFMSVNKLNTHRHTHTQRYAQSAGLTLFCKLIGPRSIEAANEHSYNDDDDDDDELAYRNDRDDGSVDKVAP